MKYTVSFQLRGKENNVQINYQAISDIQSSGFAALKLPFDAGACVGYPMLHAYFENSSLCGYERYCGWIQILERRDYDDIDAAEPVNISYELDAAPEMKEKNIPYFAYGYPAEFFDAPCKNLGGSEKLDWRAYTYLVDPPSNMNDGKLVFLAGFSWGYTEDKNGNVRLLDFETVSEETWLTHQWIVKGKAGFGER